jgi:hypothetical protein
MNPPAVCLGVASILAASLALSAPAPASGLPDDPRALTATISYGEMAGFLASVDGKGPVRVSVEGTTTKGRSIYLVHATRGGAPTFRILFYAQQHGDEVSGKDALLFLVRDVAARPELLPMDVDLWVMPMMNPDGAEAGTRRNGAGADLNRDHIVLEQPETQALHRVARRVRPHLAVDCHEFTRDSGERRARGWIAWPDITMDGVNNPLLDTAVIAAAQRWVDASAAPEAAAGHAFLRYSVGGMPPDEEQRHSAPDIDGGLNAIGMYGGLSFIIEAAVMRSADATSSDLGKRVDAYLVLLRRFVDGDGHRQDDLAAVEAARRRPLPMFIPTNYLWVNPGMTITGFPVIEAATGHTLKVPTANMMTVMAVKAAVTAPLAYAVEPGAAETFAPLLDRHGIPYEVVNDGRLVKTESCTLLRIEDDFDELYGRYGGRQIVRREAAVERRLAPRSLLVRLAGEAGVRAALVLEPAAMYGVYQYPRYRALTTPGEPLPVVRVVR